MKGRISVCWRDSLGWGQSYHLIQTWSSRSIDFNSQHFSLESWFSFCYLYSGEATPGNLSSIRELGISPVT